MNLLEISHYRILSKLGSGGSADVYLAEDAHLRRKVALKVLHRRLIQNEEQLQRFQQEARWASSLNHPGILTIFETGKSGETHYIVTEYVDGTTLSHRIASGRLTVRESLNIAIGVAEALAAAHEIWVVHRDIKPDNIMLRHDGFVKILDFGIAKLTQSGGSKLTQPGIVLGTLQYLAPEQVSGIAVDPRTDIWSLGVVLFEMIAGVHPFEAPSVADLIMKIRDDDPPPLDRTARNFPPELDAILRKALQKKMDERYETVEVMLGDLRELRDEIAFQERLALRQAQESLKDP